MAPSATSRIADVAREVFNGRKGRQLDEAADRGGRQLPEWSSHVNGGFAGTVSGCKWPITKISDRNCPAENGTARCLDENLQSMLLDDS